jgi:hypothetical protein
MVSMASRRMRPRLTSNGSHAHHHGDKVYSPITDLRWIIAVFGMEGDTHIDVRLGSMNNANLRKVSSVEIVETLGGARDPCGGGCTSLCGF